MMEWIFLRGWLGHLAHTYLSHFLLSSAIRQSSCRPHILCYSLPSHHLVVHVCLFFMCGLFFLFFRKCYGHFSFGLNFFILFIGQMRTTKITIKYRVLRHTQLKVRTSKETTTKNALTTSKLVTRQKFYDKINTYFTEKH